MMFPVKLYRKRLIDMSFLSILPPEIIIEIALKLPISNISSYCQINTKFNEIININENFWQLKFSKDYWTINYVGNWKQLYQSFVNIFVCGNNFSGELGLNDCTTRNIPTQILNVKAKQVSSITFNTGIIDLNNNVWVCGGNISGELGLGHYHFKNALTQIPNIKAKQISYGLRSLAVIDL